MNRLTTKIRVPVAAFTAILALGVGVGSAHAAPIFNYTVTVTSTNPVVSGLSSVTYTGGSDNTGTKNAGFPGGTNIGLLQSVVATTNVSGFDTFTNVPVNFTLSITDVATSATSGPINFSGTLNGSVNTTNNSLTLTISNPVSPVNFTLAGFKYTVTFNNSQFNLNTNPNPFNANVSATPIATPEPASLAIWGGLGFAGAWYGRRRLRAKAVVSV